MLIKLVIVYNLKFVAPLEFKLVAPCTSYCLMSFVTSHLGTQRVQEFC